MEVVVGVVSLRSVLVILLTDQATDYCGCCVIIKFLFFLVASYTGLL